MIPPPLRRHLFEEARRTTADDNKGRGGRKMVQLALALVAPKSSVQAKLSKCGTRDKKGSRVFCEHAACTYCMHRRADWLFIERLWPALCSISKKQLKWVTVLAFDTDDLDKGALKMERQLRALRRIMKKFAAGHPVRAFGCREVERDPDTGLWTFHFHFLIDTASADIEELRHLLKTKWKGPRAVLIKNMTERQHRTNVLRLGHYMTKARFTEGPTKARKWMSAENIAALSLWREGLASQWHRWTWGVRVKL